MICRSVVNVSFQIEETIQKTEFTLCVDIVHVERDGEDTVRSSAGERTMKFLIRQTGLHFHRPVLRFVVFTHSRKDLQKIPFGFDSHNFTAVNVEMVGFSETKIVPIYRNFSMNFLQFLHLY